MRLLARLTLVFVAFLPLLAGCGDRPVTLTAIPAFPEAITLAPGASASADSLAGALQGAVGADLTSDIRRYRLPAAAAWPEVERFYRETLEGAGWKAAPELRTEGSAFNSAGWLRGAEAGEQVLLIGYAPNLADGAPLLIVALFSKKS
ncbi:MAG: hypothetical protein RMK84_08335 [Oscillochloridaceae bacterium]|nr:hypothetical protein [Chloroflexaceae bacterium]MDW8390118.1 hypothetical protein [Oscillochloridaceae bacterium]